VGALISCFHDAWTASSDYAIAMANEFGGDFFGNFVVGMVTWGTGGTKNGDAWAYFGKLIKALDKLRHYFKNGPGVCTFNFVPISFLKGVSDAFFRIFIFWLSHAIPYFWFKDTILRE
jgi:hypothetical protein